MLLTAAGVAWGLIETMSGQGNQAGAPPPAGGGTPSTAMPPLPVMGGAPAVQIQNDAHRMVLLAISAAQADGAMGDKESAEVQRVAIEQGMAAEVAAGLTRPTPLASIVAGVTDPGQRATLYGLAFAVARADEQVSGAERIYLAQLANLLGLDPAAVAKLEATAAAKIDAAPEEGSGLVGSEARKPVAVSRKPTRGAATAMSQQEWFMAIGGHQVGPVTRDDVVTNIRNGTVDGSTLVFKAGMSNWTPLKDVPDLASFLGGGSAASGGSTAAARAGRRAHDIDFRILGSEMQFVEVELDPGESAVAEAGSMMYMTQSIEMETVFGDGSQVGAGTRRDGCAAGSGQAAADG